VVWVGRWQLFVEEALTLWAMRGPSVPVFVGLGAEVAEVDPLVLAFFNTAALTCVGCGLASIYVCGCICRRRCLWAWVLRWLRATPWAC
jgi:hypothetical protein